ncbi:MAG: transposase [Planctomycetes bacterium]|nr:transposase [Planctomycetota bacterium]MCW8134356.1 transposase [Planctomycetota bacterium]
MAYNRVLAYHLTFTTYGTRLHGDPRGTIMRGRQGRASAIVQPDPVLHDAMADKLKFLPMILTAPLRQVVHQTIESYCQFKSWPLLALHVRTNHVHCVVGAACSSSKVLHALKARATRMLREAGLIAAGRPVWTERGSQKQLFTQQAIDNAIKYVDLNQGKSLPEP